MGLCVAISFVPVDRGGAILTTRNRGATSQNSVLFSADGFRILDIVRPFRIQLRVVSFRAAWLGPPSALFDILSADIQSAQTQSTNGDSQGVRKTNKM